MIQKQVNIQKWYYSKFYTPLLNTNILKVRYFEVLPYSNVHVQIYSKIKYITKDRVNNSSNIPTVERLQ